MARGRPIKEGLKSRPFIKHKYQWMLKDHMKNRGERAYYKYLRNAANNFTVRTDVRKLVFERDGYKCKICGSTEDLTLDHIIPIVLGGENNTDNLQPLCRSCNSGKLQ